jgi:glyoxylase-like metal-dependent hydrolase (beta-lactamase superfamily II)
MCGVLCGAITVSLQAADPAIFTTRIGDFEVSLLVENQGQGRPSILIGADDALLKRYMPTGTYLSETNTFLIRSQNRIIVVDTGFGGAIFDSMKALGVSPDMVDTVLLTHLHGDHIGGLQRDGKALFPNATVYLAQREKDYWTRTNVNRGAVAALAPYSAKTQTFQPGDLNGVLRELLPGVTPVAAFGHTPGHTAYLLESAGSKLLIWGDLMHVQDIQFPVPAISVTYDTDPQAAAAVRKQILDYAVKNHIPVAGMHLAYPAIGAVTADAGGFRFVPLSR